MFLLLPVLLTEALEKSNLSERYLEMLTPWKQMLDLDWQLLPKNQNLPGLIAMHGALHLCTIFYPWFVESNPMNLVSNLLNRTKYGTIELDRSFYAS